MKALKKWMTLLLLAANSTAVFAITDAELFAWAEANYSGFFPGAPETGRYQQYDFRYYPTSGNYLAVDTSGVIFVLGPASGNMLAAVGPVTAFADAIKAWEAGNVHRLAAIANHATFYNSPSDAEIQAVAARYKVIIGESTALTSAQVNTLLAGGENKVLGYLNFAASEDTRDYYRFLGGAPADPNRPGQIFKSFAQIFPNAAPYAGWSHEFWANPANPDYQNLIVNYVAPKIAAMGFNGFFLDNVDLLERAATDSPACDTACKQGGYELLARLRKNFPNFVIIENNATSLNTLYAQVRQDPDNAQSPLVRFIDLVDGIYSEDIYSMAVPDPANAAVVLAHPQPRDPSVPNRKLSELKAIRSAFPYIWLGAEDFVEQCSAAYASQYSSYSAYAQRDGLNPYVSTLAQNLCLW